MRGEGGDENIKVRRMMRRRKSGKGNGQRHSFPRRLLASDLPHLFASVSLGTCLSHSSRLTFIAAEY